MPDMTIITAARLDTADKVRWLRDLSESILRQSFGEWEWVVVDDASPTRPDLPSDVRVRVVRAAKHSGTAMCRNTAAGLARSACILPVDADDLLPGTDTLAALWEAWKERQDHFVYGDIQLLEGEKPGKTIKFPPYEFAKTLDPKGLVHVSALHSLECWHRAGGWKPSLDWGLEDVEYWISAGAAGFCGAHLDRVTLVYRKHPQSRTQKMRAALKQRDMEGAIQRMHEDLYAGRYPMGCCGGSRSRPVAQPAPRPSGVRQPAQLAGPDRPGGKVWAQYEGSAQGEFEVRGQVTGDRYRIYGPGYRFQVWAQDANFFASLGRGKHFTVGVSPPAPPAPPPEPEPEPVPESEYQAPEPVLATIERLDPVAATTREVVKELEPEPVKPDEEDTPLDAMESLSDQQKAMLAAEGWSLEKLAEAQVEELVPYPSIGKVTAANAIAEANRLWQR